MTKTIFTLSYQDKQLKALWAKFRAGHAEVLSCLRQPCHETDLAAAGREFMQQHSPDHQTGHVRPIICFDRIRPAFYEIPLPPVKEDQVESAIAIQAETILPLPPDRMRFDWKTFASTNGSNAILAAVNASLQDRIEATARSLQPDHILLTAEAITAAAVNLFDAQDSPRTVIYIAAKTTWICFVNQGQLAGGACCDAGLDDLLMTDSIDRDIAEQLAQDIFHTVSTHPRFKDQPVEIIQCPDARFAMLADYLATLSLNVKMIRPYTERVTLPPSESVQADSAIYDWLIPLGLGFAGLAQPANRFELFPALHYQPQVRKVKIHAPGLGISLVAALLMAVVLIFSSYGKTIAQCRIADRQIESLEKKFKEMYPESSPEQWHSLQNTRKTLNPMRPDILELWGLLHEKTPQNIQMNSITCIHGEPVRIYAQAGGNDKKVVYDYQDIFIALKGVEKVILSPITYNDKEKRQYFTLSFEYGPFKSVRKKTSIFNQVSDI